jgi:putative peptidoglycan lipid II flippase
MVPDSTYPLVATAAITSAATPVGVYFASRLPEGSVAAFSMGSKVLQSITALMSAATIAVVLPHFSRMFAANRLSKPEDRCTSCSREAQPGGAACLRLFISADQVASILFAGGRVGGGEVGHLGSVIRYGALQLPFYLVLLVLIKFTIAGKGTLWVLVAATLGQIANIAAASLLAGRFGTAGLAMSTSLSIAVSSLSLLVWATIRQHLSPMSSVMVATSWMLFSTLAVCAHFHSTPGSIVCVSAFIVVAFGEFALSGLSSRRLRERVAR